MPLAPRLEGWVLPALLAWPLVGALVVWVLGRSAPVAGEAGVAAWRDARVQTVAVLGVETLLSVALWARFDPSVTGWQEAFDVALVPRWGARLTLGVDGMSLPLVLLAALLTPLAVLGSWSEGAAGRRGYCALLLVRTVGVMGALVALDLLPFALLWLLALLPTPRLLGAGGGPDCASERRWFALLVGGATVPMLVAVVVLWVSSGSRTFELDALLAATRGSLSTAGQAYLFGAFLLAFAAESALFPLHLWLPRALPAAPASAAVSLGVKVGAYGLLRFALPFFPAAASHPTLRLVAVTLAVVGMVYCTLVAAAQRELGRLVAYASAAQLGLVTLGTFALTVQGVQGALVATLGHGVSVGALLLLVGMLRRRGTTAVRSLVGAGRVVPVLAALLSLAALGAVGIPGTNGFVGAYLVLEGAYAAYPVAAVVAGLALVVAVAYLLIALRRLHRDPPGAAEGAPRVDLDRRERLVLAAFAVAIVWLGVAPEPILQRTEGAARRIVEQVTRGAEAVPVDTPGG